ncbi:hypothetical protein Asppvi_002065 [Aspergillus pseudoviridinutans]|uniref:Hydrophobic surface binding protein A-domain-containing protein n=1 Tax=Aspergillus pseudoviridinutans TaxID=1517512 RepID=A0A9P3EPR1_9EURO|nr:uncharacterized protein Asppvi_002065 [Aspergillus pseudoviridinutans]GIJ83246.1 hypothetical protein Asppvi_002065 [Aspergillus pseudoviridinutans]
MNIRTILTSLSLDLLAAYAVDAQAMATSLENTLHIMMDLSSLTSGAAMDIFPSTVDRFLPDVVGGFELITTAAENEIVVLLVSQEGTAGARDGKTQRDICENYSGFAEVHRVLMDIIIGKNETLAHGLFDPTTTVRDVLDQLDHRLDLCSKAVTSLTRSTLPLVPVCADGIVHDQESYNETVEELKSVLRVLLN